MSLDNVSLVAGVIENGLDQVAGADALQARGDNRRLVCQVPRTNTSLPRGCREFQHFPAAHAVCPSASGVMVRTSQRPRGASSSAEIGNQPPAESTVSAICSVADSPTATAVLAGRSNTAPTVRVVGSRSSRMDRSLGSNLLTLKHERVGFSGTSRRAASAGTPDVRLSTCGGHQSKHWRARRDHRADLHQSLSHYGLVGRAATCFFPASSCAD